MNGFYKKRWGDAPIHAIGIPLLLDDSEVCYIPFDWFGQRHKWMDPKPTVRKAESWSKSRRIAIYCTTRDYKGTLSSKGGGLRVSAKSSAVVNYLIYQGNCFLVSCFSFLFFLQNNYLRLCFSKLIFICVLRESKYLNILQ